MDKNKRQKASDVFADANLVFAKKSSFAEAFPDIADIRIEIKEDDFGFSSSRDTSVFTKDNMQYLGEFYDCSNPLCYNGGVSIGGLIRDMIYSKKKDLEETKICRGYEGSPKGRKKYRDCLKSFKIKINIKYKTSESS